MIVHCNIVGSTKGARNSGRAHRVYQLPKIVGAFVGLRSFNLDSYHLAVMCSMSEMVIGLVF